MKNLKTLIYIVLAVFTVLVIISDNYDITKTLKSVSWFQYYKTCGPGGS